MKCIECEQDQAILINVPLSFETEILIKEINNIQGKGICISCLIVNMLEILTYKKK
jgi:hypothetical protein